VASAAVLAGAGAAAFAASVLLGLALVGRYGGGPVQGWDDSVQHWMLHHRDGLVGVSKLVGTVGDAPYLGVLAAAVTAALAARRRSLWAAVPLVSYFGGEAEVFAIRLVVHRPRPPTAVFPAPGATPGMHETSFSFPSGHAVAVTAVLFGTLGAVGLARRSWAPWVAATLASVAVAGSRVVLGVHWFGDVTVGLLVGAAFGTAVAVAAQRYRWDGISVGPPPPSTIEKKVLLGDASHGPVAERDH
jgi:membrane-associated phospholipid phosphatase